MARLRLFKTTSARNETELGFQRFIAARPGERMAVVTGQDSSRWTDFYHTILSTTWPLFLASAAAIFFLITLVFAGLYRLDPGGIANAKPDSFWDAFVFSAQTLETVNSRMLGNSDYVSTVQLIEAFMGILNIAMLTGLMFARFSRPSARVVFSKVAIIIPYDGVPTLMFRAANQRGNQIMDATMTVSLARQSMSQEGLVMRRFEELQLMRPRSLLFALSWTVMHRIDEASPLFGTTKDALAAGQAELFVLLQGRDDLLADTIYARHSYRPSEILWGQRFVDVLGRAADGRRSVDLHRFHDTEPFEQLSEPEEPAPMPANLFWSN